MEILEIAIKAEGGVSKLACALGERQNVVSNWKKRGVPRAWRQVLELRYLRPDVPWGVLRGTEKEASNA